MIEICIKQSDDICIDQISNNQNISQKGYQWGEAFWFDLVPCKQIQKPSKSLLKLHAFFKFYSYNCKIAVAFFSYTILEEGTNLLLSSDVTMTRYGDNCRVKCVHRWHQIAWIYVPCFAWKKRLLRALVPAPNWKESEFRSLLSHKRFLPFIGKWKSVIYSTPH